MLIFIFIFIFVPSLSYADCYDCRSGFHVLHISHEPKLGTAYSLHEYVFTDPFYTVRLDYTGIPNPSKILFNGKITCSKDEYSHFISKAGTLFRVKACDEKVVPPHLPFRGLAFYDNAKKILHIPFPNLIEGKPVKEISKTRIFEESINQFISNKDFQVTAFNNGIHKISSKSFKVSSYEHLSFSNDFISSKVSFQTLENPPKTFSAIFIFYKNKLWPLAQASSIAAEDTVTNLSGVYFQEDGAPIIIKFKDPEFMYFIDFGKELRIINSHLNDKVYMTEGKKSDERYGFKEKE